jgi:hypothetical protein
MTRKGPRPPGREDETARVSENDLGDGELPSNRAVWEVGRADVDVVLIRVVLDVPQERPRLIADTSSRQADARPSDLCSRLKRHHDVTGNAYFALVDVCSCRGKG